MITKMKRDASAIDGHDDIAMETQSSIRRGRGDISRIENSKGGYRKKQLESSRNYVSWNRDMDKHLAKVLIDQMAEGKKCDGDTWRPEALQAAVTYLNSKLHLNLSKENIKNRLKAWKKYYSVVTDVQKQSGFSWDEERKMIVVTSDEHSSWKEYVESHPGAKGLQNKVIENWNDIALLCGRDKVTGLNTQTFEEGPIKMGDEEDAELKLAQEQLRPSDSLDSMRSKRKKAKIDALVEVVGMIATSFQDFVASKKKEERPSGIEIYEVVSSITELTSIEKFKAVEKLMSGDAERFRLLKALPDEERRGWLNFLIDS
ncbi:uncharacterized protein [Henckelia pumila]|uniref:uncharacterized protein n=1 Tax=Henckelia pumila TaxID=405737 RepID=UPI003C6E8A42